MHFKLLLLCVYISNVIFVIFFASYFFASRIPSWRMIVHRPRIAGQVTSVCSSHLRLHALWKWAASAEEETARMGARCCCRARGKRAEEEDQGPEGSDRFQRERTLVSGDYRAVSSLGTGLNVGAAPGSGAGSGESVSSAAALLAGRSMACC